VLNSVGRLAEQHPQRWVELAGRDEFGTPSIVIYRRTGR